MSIYKNFERLIKEKNITAYQVGKATGISTATLSSWKKGRYSPKTDKLNKISKFLGVSLEALINEEENKKTGQE